MAAEVKINLLANILKPKIKSIAEPIALALGKIGLTPNLLTLIGFLLNIAVAVILGYGHLMWGGIALLIVSAVDMLDGALARASGQVTKFGAFWDSSLDRYSEAVIFAGLLFWIMPSGDPLYGILLISALIGSLMLSYTRARAEGLGMDCEVGILARPERIIILGIALIINQVIWGLGIIAVLANLTAFYRIYHVWKKTRNNNTLT